jgi:hypothetical protein
MEEDSARWDTHAPRTWRWLRSAGSGDRPQWQIN